MDIQIFFLAKVWTHVSKNSLILKAHILNKISDFEVNKTAAIYMIVLRLNFILIWVPRNTR